ncbi:MAG: hypothetical protein ACLUKN_05385 [Bacilli bacterium]
MRISLDYGEIYMAMLSPRPTSRTIIKTTFGAVEPKTTAMYISCGKITQSSQYSTGRRCSADLTTSATLYSRDKSE